MLHYDQCFSHRMREAAGFEVHRHSTNPILDDGTADEG